MIMVEPRKTYTANQVMNLIKKENKALKQEFLDWIKVLGKNQKKRVNIVHLEKKVEEIFI